MYFDQCVYDLICAMLHPSLMLGNRAIANRVNKMMPELFITRKMVAMVRDGRIKNPKKVRHYDQIQIYNHISEMDKLDDFEFFALTA